jgi:citrate lyase subunit beta/citryl-CoA lyase
MNRSYLFAPGHNEKLLVKAFHAGADAVMLDLEDAVPPDAKDAARRLVAKVLVDHPGWVRVNAARTDRCAADLDAMADDAHGIRIPKTESPEDVAWVVARAPGKPIICAIETARGLLAAQEIAAAPGVRHLAMGGVDLQHDLRTSGGSLQTLHARSHLVIVSRAARIEPPIDSVYPRLDDEAGLRKQAEFARSLGFFGKSAIHPRQLAVLHEVFSPTENDIAWARQVLAAFDAAGGAALRLPDGEFVDLPVAQQARRVLDSERSGLGVTRPTCAGTPQASDQDRSSTAGPTH